MESIATNLTGTSYTYELSDTNDSDNMHYAFVAVAYNSRHQVSINEDSTTIYATTSSNPITISDRDNDSLTYNSNNWIGNSSIAYFVTAQSDPPFETPYPPYNLNVSSGQNLLTISWEMSSQKPEETGNTSYSLYLLGDSTGYLDSSRDSSSFTLLEDSNLYNANDSITFREIYSGSNTSYTFSSLNEDGVILNDNTRYAFAVVSYNSQDLVSQDTDGNIIYGTTSSTDVADNGTEDAVYDSNYWLSNTTVSFYAQGITNEPTINTSSITGNNNGVNGIRWKVNEGETGSKDNNLRYSGFVKLDDVDSTIFSILGPDEGGKNESYEEYILSSGSTEGNITNNYFSDLVPGKTFTGTVSVWTNMSSDNDDSTAYSNWQSNTYSDSLTTYSYLRITMFL